MRSYLLPLLLSVVLVPGVAHAVPKSPVSIADQLGLPYEPPCRICHSSAGVPNAGDVDEPFGRSMIARGLVPNDRPSLNAALAQLADERVDSDGDGIPDVVELRLGLDPSRADSAGAEDDAPSALVDASAPPAAGGCALAARDAGMPLTGGCLLGAALAACALRRRRGREGSAGNAHPWA